MKIRKFTFCEVEIEVINWEIYIKKISEYALEEEEEEKSTTEEKKRVQ